MENLRILAAIMFTDMVGYTKLMQEDESKARTIREKHKNILEEKILQHQGRLLQYYGDGSLSIFGSVIEAVLAAKNIQKELSKEPKIPIRVGIHLGDIVYEDDAIFGDGVNIASRIENLALGGSILISEKVYDELQNHPDINCEPLGSFKLKNVKKPVNIFALKDDFLVVPSENDLSNKKKSEEVSIAVLPFLNMSADQENEYFSDGITEEILNTLCKIDGLKVTSRTSSFAFKGLTLDVREIGHKLSVNHILEGSVRKAGNKVRITTQLIEIKTGFHTWSETFDRELKDIFEVQDEISKTIVDKLKDRFNLSKEEKLVKKRTDNTEAYNYYLKGVYLFNKMNPFDAKKAIECYEKAIELDEEYAQPYQGISWAYSFLGAVGYIKPKKAFPISREFATKALALDIDLSEAHLVIAINKMFFEWDWKGAEKEYLNAIKLNPDLAETYEYFAYLLTALKRYDEALEKINIAHELNPLSLSIINTKAHILFNMGHENEAEKTFLKVFEFDKNYMLTIHSLGWLYIKTNQYEKAEELLLRFSSKELYDFKLSAELCYLYSQTGKLNKAKEILEEMEKESKRTEDVSYSLDLAVAYAGFKEYDKVFHYLNIACEERLGSLIFLHQKHWDILNDDSRYLDLLKRMDFIK